MSSILLCVAGRRSSLRLLQSGRGERSQPAPLSARIPVVAVLAVALAVLSGCAGSAAGAPGGGGQPQVTPTPWDRLAAPTLPEDPSQADHGSYTYWARCMACHGDLGQGLTDEFRALYPPEDQNCWESGCHGPRPYENGFTLPASIPALFGEGRLSTFGDAARLQAFIAAAMPWHDPGSLSQDEYWQVTAFLLRENGRDPGAVILGPDNAGDFSLPPLPDSSPEPSASSAEEPAQAAGPDRYHGVLVAIGLFLMIALWARMELLRKTKGTKK